jgi:large subunit ribosomal protein L13
VHQEHRGLKSEKANEGRFTPPDIARAVRGMIPKNRLGRQMIKKLKVYAGPVHNHAAQDPQTIEFAHAKAR